MKRQLKDLIKKNYALYKLFLSTRVLINSLNFFNYIRFKTEISKRTKLSIFDFNELSRDLVLYSKEIINENSFYGNDVIVKKSIRWNRFNKYVIEHGYYFGNYVPSYTFSIKSLAVVTFSEKRLEHISNAFKNHQRTEGEKTIITIGPYINYAQNLLSFSEKERIKKKYGRILLVFPSHSTENVNYIYDIENFFKKINEIARDYNSVFICMYWKDIQDGKYAEYQKKGYKIVTAGHRSDPNFLSRLKDIIELSDMTMSNSIGTNIGYCIARGRPHYLFYQQQEVHGENIESEFKDRKTRDYLQSSEQEKNEIIDIFSKFSNHITDNQQKIVEKYWGKNEVCYHKITK